MNCSHPCVCGNERVCDLVRLANTMRHSRDSWRRDRTRAGGWVKAASCAPRRGRRFHRRALRRPRASATLCERENGMRGATKRCAHDLPCDSPAYWLVELLAGLLALVSAKIKYAQPQPVDGSDPRNPGRILAGNVPAKVGSLPSTKRCFPHPGMAVVSCGCSWLSVNFRVRWHESELEFKVEPAFGAMVPPRRILGSTRGSKGRRTRTAAF